MAQEKKVKRERGIVLLPAAVALAALVASAAFANTARLPNATVSSLPGAVDATAGHHLASSGRAINTYRPGAIICIR